MKNYLLVGNGGLTKENAGHNADCIVQFNGCRHSASLPMMRNGFIFITNSGVPGFELSHQIQDIQERVPHSKIILARNPLYYTLKCFLLWCLGVNYKDYLLCNDFKNHKYRYPLKTVPFLFSLMLDIKLIRRGMPISCMPSTGVIAYEWLKKQAMPWDHLEIDGFTFEGWYGHPWEIEKQIVVPVN